MNPTLKYMQQARLVGRSKLGYMCQTSRFAREGDSIFILRSANVPFVLRPKGDAWEFIGDAYVHGIMQGEAHEEKLYKPIELV